MDDVTLPQLLTQENSRILSRNVLSWTFWISEEKHWVVTNLFSNVSLFTDKQSKAAWQRFEPAHRIPRMETHRKGGQSTTTCIKTVSLFLLKALMLSAPPLNTKLLLNQLRPWYCFIQCELDFSWQLRPHRGSFPAAVGISFYFFEWKSDKIISKNRYQHMNLSSEYQKCFGYCW